MKFKKGDIIKSFLSPTPKEIIQIRRYSEKDASDSFMPFTVGTECYVMQFKKGNGNIVIYPIEYVDSDNILESEKGYWEKL